VTASVDGSRLRADWDEVCNEAIATVRAAVKQAEADDQPDFVVSYLRRQASSVQEMRAAADGRRRIPGEVGFGILRDIPPELAEPRYADAVEALSRAHELWRNRLGAPEWDWSRGYPPDWPMSFGDRVKAGLFYSAR